MISLKPKLADNLFGKLTGRSKAALDALIRSPLAEQALQSIETEELTQREAIIKELQELDAAFPAERDRLDWIGIRAKKKLDGAERAFRAAKLEYDQAVLNGYGTNIQHEQRRGELIELLEANADPRLDAMVFHLRNLADNDVRMKVKFWVDFEKEIFRKRPVYGSNVDLLAKARDALLTAISEVLQLKREPLGYAEISQRLSKICIGLAPVLAELDLNPPLLYSEHVEVGAPVAWGGSSVWVLDKQPEPLPKEVEPVTGAQARESRLGTRRAQIAELRRRA